jgi:hypothetical protein
MNRFFQHPVTGQALRTGIPSLALVTMACFPQISQARSQVDLSSPYRSSDLITLSTQIEASREQGPIQLNQLPGEPLPNDSFDQSFNQETYRAPLPIDYYNHGQQVGQYATNSGYAYDPLSVCQHLSTEFSQQCMEGYSNGYGAELSSEEISSYYYSQGYQSGKEDAEAGHDYDPHNNGYQALHDNTARKDWSDGYHSGYWETVAE